MSDLTDTLRPQAARGGTVSDLRYRLRREATEQEALGFPRVASLFREAGARVAALEAEAERLTAEVERLRDKLTEICDMDWLDSALDNRWPSRIARTALAGEGDEDDE